MMIVKNTDVYLNGERYMAFDDAFHATAFAAGYNGAVEAKAKFFARDWQKVIAMIESHVAHYAKFGIATPWHAGFLTGGR